MLDIMLQELLVLLQAAAAAAESSDTHDQQQPPPSQVWMSSLLSQAQPLLSQLGPADLLPGLPAAVHHRLSATTTMDAGPGCAAVHASRRSSVPSSCLGCCGHLVTCATRSISSIGTSLQAAQAQLQDFYGPDLARPGLLQLAASTAAATA